MSAIKTLKKYKKDLEEENKGHEEYAVFYLEKSEWHRARLEKNMEEIKELTQAIEKLKGSKE